MSYNFVTGTGAVNGGQNGATTTGVDTTGGDLSFANISASSIGGTAPSDSKGNTWSPRTAYLDAFSAGTQLYYSQAPTVGTGHTFTFSRSNSFSAICVGTFSGSTTSPFDVENGMGTVGTSPTAPGSITPTQDNELCITGFSLGAGSGAAVSVGTAIVTCSSGQFGLHYGAGLAYSIQTTAAAFNPSWSWTGGSTDEAASNASFKAPGGAVVRTSNLPMMGI